MDLADLVEHGAYLLDGSGRSPAWYDHTGLLPPVFDIGRCPPWAQAAPGEVFARQHFATVPFDARTDDDPTPNSALGRVCAVLEDGSFPAIGSSILLWRLGPRGWRSMGNDAPWPDAPAPRRALEVVLDAVRTTIEQVVTAAAAMEGSPYAGARISSVVTYNIQRRQAGGAQFKPHFDYESAGFLQNHIQRYDPTLQGRALSVLTIWLATEALTSSPLLFYPRGTLSGQAMDLPPVGQIAMVDLGDMAVTDSRVTAAEGRAFLFNPNLRMHGAAGAPDDAGRIYSRRRSLEIRSFVLWEDGFSPSTRDCRA